MNHAIHLHDAALRCDTVTPRAAGRTPVPSTLSDLLQLMGAKADDQAAAQGVPVPTRILREGETLFHEGAQAQAVYFVRAGTFKTFRTAEDGYEQVLGFVGRTELLGFDALCNDRHPTTAVALEDSSVYVVLTRDIFALGQRMPALDRVLHLAASSELTHRAELADVMAAVAAEVHDLVKSKPAYAS